MAFIHYLKRGIVKGFLIVLAGIVLGQFILYGPSLIGKKVLLPLDILSAQNVYLPPDPSSAAIVPHDMVLSDLVLLGEPTRLYAVSELRSGHLPMWNPNQFAGSPAVWPKFSPFLLLESFTKSPIILAWTQLLIGIVAGFGAFIFFRRALSVGFWAAAIPAWCYPLTGFFIFWQGYAVSHPVCWLPWLLLSVHDTIEGRSKFSVVGLGLFTGLVLVCGAIDISGQVLLISGLYAVWRLIGKMHVHEAVLKAATTLTVGWLLGFMLAAPYLMPLLEYSKTGARMERRSSGVEERPPVGISALPQVVLPDFNGTTQAGRLWLSNGNQNESSCVAYAGIFATLFLAPLALASRRHLSINIFFCLLAFFGLSWCLNVPGFVDVLRLPGLNMMSHNRLTFGTSFAVLAMAAIGLEVLFRGDISKRWWFWIPATTFAGLFLVCFYRTIVLPEPVNTRIEASIRSGTSYWGIESLQQLGQIQNSFIHYYSFAAVLCAIGTLGWLILWQQTKWPKWSIGVVGFLLITDLLCFAYGRHPQCDWKLDYPKIPALEAIAKATPGRVIGFSCLPASLAQTHGLMDIRGYDAIDPARLMQVMKIAADPRSINIEYALTQWFIPRVQIFPPDIIKVSPILDMLGVRYIIFRGEVMQGITPSFQSNDYWVLENKSALPRAFVPIKVEVTTNGDDELKKMSSPEFNPRAVAYVESQVQLPETCSGDVSIASEDSNHVKLSAEMKTAGMVVLSDLWDKGWQAFLNGQSMPILRVNYAIRGVVVPAGNSTIEFRYNPKSFITGLRLAGLSLAILLCWSGVIIFNQRRTKFASQSSR